MVSPALMVTVAFSNEKSPAGASLNSFSLSLASSAIKLSSVPNSTTTSVDGTALSRFITPSYLLLSAPKSFVEGKVVLRVLSAKLTRETQGCMMRVSLFSPNSSEASTSLNPIT